jgi:hypothetical protein
MLENVRPSDDYDSLVSAHGFIMCSVERRKLLGPKLEKMKYEGDEETHLSRFNVSCVIYPDSTEQIDYLADALMQLQASRH